MRKWFVLGVVLALLIAVAVPASALTFWYGGDPTYQQGLASENGGMFNGAMVYDDFNVSGKGWSIHTLLGNFYLNNNVSDIYFEVRSGVTEGDGGTLVKSGTIDVTQAYIGSDGGYKLYTLAGNTPSFALSPGKYWLGIAPISKQNNSTDFAYTAETNGTGGFGKPLQNGNSFFTWANGGYYFNSTAGLVGAVNADFSYGVMANPVVPEPGSMLVLGMGLVTFMPFMRRRK